jgi:hypothetical protein
VRRNRNTLERKNEKGVVILLVAVFLLFVVGAMAVLAIDVVTFYTARSEAQLAADGAALAAARVLANSGMTSNPSNAMLVSNSESFASTVATQVGQQNRVGGRNLSAAEINITFSGSLLGAGYNPRVTVKVTRNDLPTFFAHIWGRNQVTVSASATAEAYNPSGLTASLASGPPVAPACVKPWLLPNIDPRPGNTNTIFDATTGSISANPTTLLGWTDPGNFSTRCTNCAGPPMPAQWKYYPGDPATFAAPSQGLPACSAGFTDYQKSIVGCVETPIACNSTVNIDLSSYATRDQETADSVNCLAHSLANKGDKVDTALGPSPPFQFLAGDDNPVPNARGKDVFVSDSLVTVPVFDHTNLSNPVQIIGFVQLFLNPDGVGAPVAGIKSTIINLAGCGTAASGQPILGNGSSPVAVRLVR